MTPQAGIRSSARVWSYPYYPSSQKCTNPQSQRLPLSQRSDCCMQKIRQENMASSEWLPPVKFGGNQDELHQTAGRAADGEKL